MTILKYSLEDFTNDMESLLQGQPDQQKLFDKGSAYLERLIANPRAIPTQYQQPTGVGSRPNHGSYLLYQGDSGLQVTAVDRPIGRAIGSLSIIAKRYAHDLMA